MGQIMIGLLGAALHGLNTCDKASAGHITDDFRMLGLYLLAAFVQHRAQTRRISREIFTQ